ncbi:MAG: hypothetical protein ABSE49_15630 [Polyangiaceae bacterium]
MRPLPAVLVAVSLSLPAGLLYGCGGSVNGGSAPPDAAPEAATESPEAGATVDAGAGVDAAPDTGGYQNQAPHCARTDAGIADPFDAGAEPDVIALPQVVGFGGTTLHHPTFISVTWPADTYADELEDFTASVGCTDYWHAITADYGVGEAVAGPQVVLTEKAPTTIDDTAIQTWLAGKIDSNDPQFPRPAVDTVYALWYPESTTITLEGATSCSGFGGYHNGWKLSDGTPFSYAVMPRCPTQGGETVMDGLTTAASHEFIEACTDPQPFSAPAYAAPDSNHSGWLFAEASEVGDMCEFDQSAYYQPTGYPWYVQKIYSNRAAWAGTEPCVPADSPSYFYAAAQVPNSEMLDVVGDGMPVPTAVVTVPVGSTVTIPVLLVGSSDITSMQLQAFDLAQFTGAPTVLGLTLNPSTGAPGQTVQLTITKMSAEPMGAGGFAILSQSGQTQTFSIGMTTDQ